MLGDETALRRAFQNLVANAIKYGGAGSWIGVRARQAGREVFVTIADRGIGIAPRPEDALELRAVGGIHQLAMQAF